jgi:tetratricopeptide (TPR) repeat protein
VAEKKSEGFGEVESEAEEAHASASVDPVAAAIAMDEAAKHPAVAAHASAFLKAQKKLVELQVKHFDEEHHLAIDAAKLKRAMDWLKLGVQAAIALVFAGVAAGLIAMVSSAAQDRSLVIDSFTVPPDLAQRQITGEQLAALVADKLATIDAHAESFRAPATYETNWGHEIHIEVPATGVSISELDHVLREHLGRQTRISGALYHEGGVLRLSVRTGEGEALEVEGDDAHIDALTSKAAEAIFGKTQPYAYSKYLEFAGRKDEAMKVARALAADGPASERAWAWAQISNLLSERDLAAAYDAGMRATALDPGLSLAWLNAANPQRLMGHDQASSDLNRRSIDVARRGGGGLSAVGVATSEFNDAGFGTDFGEFLRAAVKLRDADARVYGGLNASRSAMVAQAFAAAHDLPASRRLTDALTDAQLITQLYLLDDYYAPEYLRAVEAEDWTAAIAAAQSQLDALAKAPEGPELTRYARERFVLPNMAYALAKAGRMAEAQKITATLAQDCYLCLRTRARVAAMAGDWPEATRNFAEAVRQNPKLPFADLEWGRALLDRGDRAGAVAHFERAAKLAPKFADPLKYWGDVLLSEGKSGEAISKYADAALCAPHWPDLHRKWAEALAKTGEADAARKQYALAAAL